MTPAGEAPLLDEPLPPTPPVAVDDDPGREPTPAPVEIRSWSWHVMQLTSWLLVVLLPVHVFSTWVFHDPGHIGVAWYVDRWHSGGWRLFDGVLLVVALVHGGLGLDGALARRTTRPAVRTTVAAVIAVVLGTVGLLALSTIFTFNLS